MVINNTIPWIDKLNIKYIYVADPVNTIRAKSAASIRLHEIVKGLRLAIKNNHVEYRNEELLKKIHFLSKKQLIYYKSKKFAFVEQFFSALRNLFALGKFHSSAALARNMSGRLLCELKRQKARQMPKPTSSQIINSSLLEHSKSISAMPKQENEPKIDQQLPIDKSKVEEVRDEKIAEKTPELQKPLSTKEKIIKEICQLGNNPGEKFISDVWDNLLKDENIKHWEKISDHQTKYKINFHKPLKGKYKGKYKKWKFYIHETIEFVLHERGTKKIMDFSIGKNVGFKGPLSSMLKGIEVEESIDDPDEHTATFIIDGSILIRGKYPVSTSKALRYLKKIQWK